MMEIYVKTDYGIRTVCICHHLGSQDFQTTLSVLQDAGFESVPTAEEPPDVMVAIQMPAGGFVPGGGGSPSPEQHPQRYYLPRANVEETKAALEAIGITC